MTWNTSRIYVIVLSITQTHWGLSSINDVWNTWIPPTNGTRVSLLQVNRLPVLRCIQRGSITVTFLSRSLCSRHICHPLDVSVWVYGKFTRKRSHWEGDPITTLSWDVLKWGYLSEHSPPVDPKLQTKPGISTGQGFSHNVGTST